MNIIDFEQYKFEKYVNKVDMYLKKIAALDLTFDHVKLRTLLNEVQIQLNGDNDEQP